MTVADGGRTLGLGDGGADHVGVRAGVGDGLVVGHHVVGGGGHGGRIVEVAASGELGELAGVLRKHTSDQREGDRTRSPAPHSAATGGASGWRSRDRASQSSHTPRGTSLPLVTVTLFHAATKCTRSDPGSGSNSPPPTILQISCPPHVGQGHCRAFWTPLCPKKSMGARQPARLE